jgi:hypothetical protein
MSPSSVGYPTAKQGYAVVARHEVITHHFDRLAVWLEELTTQVGGQAAVEMIAEQLEQGIEEGTGGRNGYQ